MIVIGSNTNNSKSGFSEDASHFLQWWSIFYPTQFMFITGTDLFEHNVAKALS